MKTSLLSLRKNSGFSMIEVLVSIIIMSVGLIGLSKLQGTLMRSAGLSKARTEAVHLAQDKMEKFRHNILKSEFDAILSTAGISTCSTDYITDPGGPITGINTSFTRCWKVVDAPISATSPERKIVTIKIKWTDPKDGPQLVYLSSIIMWDNPANSAKLAGAS